MLRLVANAHRTWLEVSHGRRRTTRPGSPVAAGAAGEGQVLAIVTAPQRARRTVAAGSGPGGAHRRAEREPIGRSGPGTHWSDAAVAIRVLPRYGRSHGPGPGRGCGDRAADCVLRRRAHLQFRTVCIARASPAVRPQ